MAEQPIDTSWWEVMTDAEWESYSPGQHWEPFGVREIERVVQELPAVIDQGVPAMTVLANRRLAAMVQPLPPGEPSVLLLACPQAPVTTMITVQVGPEQNLLKFVCPFMQGSPNVPITLDRAVLTPDRCNAILHGTLPDGSTIGFFDLHWGATRALYRKGAAPEFILSLLAYHVRVIDGPQPLTTPAWIVETRATRPELLPPEWRDGETIDVGAIDAWLMRPDMAPDEMELWGTVESVERQNHALRGQGILKVVVAAGARRIAVFVTDHVAQGMVPRTGDRIAAFGWLNGALWWVP